MQKSKKILHKKLRKIRSKIIASYLMIIMVLFVFMAYLFHYSVNGLFESYVLERQEKAFAQIVEQITNLYQGNGHGHGGSLTEIEVIANAALQNGYIVSINTNGHESSWDIRTHKNEECHHVLQQIEYNMNNKYPDFEGGYEEKSFDLVQKEKVIGNIQIGYYGPYSLNEEEIYLMDRLSQIMLILLVIAILIAGIVGVWLSERITKPITKVINATKQIAEGDYGIQIKEDENSKETAELQQAVNTMSKALYEERNMKKQMSADIAHELRTPLSNLQGQLEAMLDGIWLPTEEKLNSCYEEVLRLTSMVNQLRELYTLENIESKLSYTEFELKEMCELLFQEFEPKLVKKNIPLKLDIESEIMLKADYVRMKQCMTNLLENAIQYSNMEKEIKISCFKQSQDVIIQVRNYGKQIPQEDIKYVFDRFYRVDKSRSTKTGGMGIGLAITKAIVEKHGGIIHVESFESGETIFEIRIPQSY